MKRTFVLYSIDAERLYAVDGLELDPDDKIVFIRARTPIGQRRALQTISRAHPDQVFRVHTLGDGSIETDVLGVRKSKQELAEELLK